MSILRKLIAQWRYPKPAPLSEDSGRAKRGVYGEALAAHFLATTLGYRIILRNWKIPKGLKGELDLICRDEASLVFVEVRSRHQDSPVSGVQSVNKRKRAVLARAIKAYLKSMRRPPKHFRFDIIDIALSNKGEGTVRHYKNVRLFHKHFSVYKN